MPQFNRHINGTIIVCMVLFGFLSVVPNDAENTLAVPIESARDSQTMLDLIERLKNTRLVNEEEIYTQLNLTGPKGIGTSERPKHKSFLTHNPFEPPFEIELTALTYTVPENKNSWELVKADKYIRFRGQEPVLQWYSESAENETVCAVQFIDETKIDYRLRTFKSVTDAQQEGYLVTHYNHCGTCSSLKNLAVYFEFFDMTTIARDCGRKRGAKTIKTCFMETMGLQERCAEAWTYNSQHTRKYCTDICVKHYGLWNLMRNNVNKPHNDEDGNLNPCLACDEQISGPGFQFFAGRTRRNSGIESAVLRPLNEILSVDHSLYFD